MVILFIGGCDSNEDISTELLTGSWVVKNSNNSNLFLEQIYTFYPDKRFVIDIKRTEDEITENYRVSGLYSIDGRIINYEALESNHPMVPVGQKDWNEILILNDETSITKDSQGEIIIAERAIVRMQGPVAEPGTPMR